MLFGLLTILFVIVSLLLGFFVLIQSDKGGGISGAIGGGFSSASNVLGAQNTENILTRGTAILATAYFILTILLFMAGSRMNATSGGVSELKQRAASKATNYVPATTAPMAVESEKAAPAPIATPADVKAVETEKTAPATTK